MHPTTNSTALHEGGLRNRGIQYLSAAIVVAVLSLWHVAVTGYLPWEAFAAFALFVLVCFTYGHGFLVATAGLFDNRAGLSFQFLSGFFLFNTLLFVLAIATPFGMLVNVAMVSAGALAWALFGKKQQHQIWDAHAELPSLLCILVSATAATFWCWDAQRSPIVQGSTAVYQTWQDMFVHVRQISAFAQAHGIGTIYDIRMSGAPAPVYHFASYLSAAAASVVTGASAMDVYASFQLPLGIFLTGLAAFALIASIWGAWPALAAVVAVVLLPDAYQQGFANRYLSYNFLAQINLGMLYGIACAVMAWVFMLEGCRRGKIASILIAYAFLAVSLFYKAHLFVANAYLILIYPCVFLSGIRVRWRVATGILFTAVFVVVVAASQMSERVPLMRLDGSGIGQYIVVLLSDFDAGWLKTFFTHVFRLEHHSKPVEALYVAAMLSISTFGLWMVAYPLVAIAMCKRTTAAVWFFPLLVIANYLVMAIGLALDTHGVGTPDELLNRPLVWAYFVVAAWTAGAGYCFVVGDALPKSRLARSSLLVGLCLATAGPLIFSKNLQTFPARRGFAHYDEFNAVPICLVRASQYIRDHSPASDVVQDSENDPRSAVTALTERQRFAGEIFFAQPPLQLQTRLDGLAAFKLMRNADELQAYAASHAISWYLLHPGATVSWPDSFLRQAVFDCQGYRVYRFAK